MKWRLLIFYFSFLPFFASAQTASSGVIARGASGQFVVTGAAQLSPLASLPILATNAAFVRLEPALLAVSAERIKKSLWHDLGIDGAWSGKIFLTLHPAQSSLEDVTIASEKFSDGWNYRVMLPDVLPRTRFMRAMVAVELLEFANRSAATHSAEIPAWLIDGLSQKLLMPDSEELVLSSPDKTLNGLPESRTVTTGTGVDPLASTWRMLLDNPALTFDELSWPTDGQLSGDDGGVYRASAQLFVNELLGLKNGPAYLRGMLQTLPRYYNWQTAFQTAFITDFPRPLDVEKWWALQTFSFIARERNPAWTQAVSREKLDDILSVDANVRFASNALPARAEISLQAVILNLNHTQQSPVLQMKLWNLDLAQLRMAGQFAVLTAEYRRVLGDYLEQFDGSVARATVSNKHPQASSSKILVHDTIKKLDVLDARRQAVESVANSGEIVQPSLVQRNF